MKKMYIGLMALAIIGLLFVSGCITPKPTPKQTIEIFKDYCVRSSGVYIPDITPDNNDDRGCDCRGIQGNDRIILYNENQVFTGCGPLTTY